MAARDELPKPQDIDLSKIRHLNTTALADETLQYHRIRVVDEYTACRFDTIFRCIAPIDELNEIPNGSMAVGPNGERICVVPITGIECNRRIPITTLRFALNQVAQR
jgi:hypothetical protein